MGNLCMSILFRKFSFNSSVLPANLGICNISFADNFLYLLSEADSLDSLIVNALKSTLKNADISLRAKYTSFFYIFL